MNYYDKLGLSRNASGNAIRTAYRALARRYHPDIAGSGSAEKFREIQEAYETLSVSSRRHAYDIALHAGQRRVHVTVILSKTSSPRFAEPLRTSHRRDQRSTAFTGLEQVFDQFFRGFDMDWF